jgi:DNA-binding transcriptional LysR family regulator
MELDNLKAFLIVAETGSFSRAAEKLFLTQPAISKRISSLESELDTRLFDRIGHRINLTEAGKSLLPRAQRILIEVEDSRRAVANLTGSVSGPLAIGTSHHIGLHRLPPVLREFTQVYPQVHLNIEFMDSEAACNSVLHGELELGIVTLPLENDPSLRLLPIWHDPLAIVVAPGHPLSKKKKIEARQLSEYPSVLPSSGTFTREVLERTLKPLGVELHTGMATNYLETIKMLVSVGLGWSVLPCSMLDKDLKVINVKGLEMQRTLGAVMHVERTLSNAALALVRMLEQYGDIKT